MKFLSNYWKVLLAAILLLAAVVVLLLVFRPETQRAEQQMESTASSIAMLELQLQSKIAENVRLESIQDDVGPAMQEISKALERQDADRETLYHSFPGGVMEEDQLLYVMDLEDILGMEIMFGRTYDSLSGQQGQDVAFAFGDVRPISYLSDGSMLCCVNIKIDFDMPYDAFKQMLLYLANDERITTINYTKIDYDPYNNHVVGYATLLYYFLDSEAVPYQEPVIDGQEAGKTTLFE